MKSVANMRSLKSIVIMASEDEKDTYFLYKQFLSIITSIFV